MKIRIKARQKACFFDTKKESGTSEYTRFTALAPMKRCFFERDTVKNAIYEKWLDGRLRIMDAGCFGD